MPDPRDPQLIDSSHNTARYFVEHRSVGWMLLLLTIAFGLWGYRTMPKQKDPTIPVRVAVAVTQWPGADALQVEQLITRAVEETMAKNPHLQDRGFFIEMEHPVVGKIRVPGEIFRLPESPFKLRYPAPLLGQHNIETYCDDLGYSRDALIRLRQLGAI